MNLSQQFLKNVSSSFFGFFIRIVLTFIFIPMITGTFGEERYGVWVIVFQIVTYFAVFDFGLSSALTRYISKYLAKNDFININKSINSANIIYTFIGLSVFGLIILFNQYFFSYLKIDNPAYVIEGKETLLIMGGFIAINFILKAFGGSLGAYQREDFNRILIIIEEIIRYTTMIIMLKLGCGLVTLAWIVFILSLSRNITGMIIVKLLFKEVRFSYKQFDSSSLKTLWNYSWISFGISMGWMIMFSTDNFILGFLSSSAAAGIYMPGSQLMLYFRNIINNVGIPLIPAVSHIETADGLEKVKNIYYKNIKYTTLLSAALIAGVYFFAKPFVALWLDPAFYQTADVMIILSLGTIAFIPNILNNSILFGTGLHKYILISLVFETAIKLILAIIYVPEHGLIAMAWSNSISQLVVYTTLYPLLCRKALKISLSKTLNLSLRSFSPVLIVLAAAGYLMTRYFYPSSWSLLALEAAVILTLFALISFRVIEPDDRQLLKDFIRKIISRKQI